MTAPAPYQSARQYQRARIETASPTRLVVMLYDGAIRFLTMALDRMRAGDYEAKNDNFVKAQRIVSELLSSLNVDQGGEVAANLKCLYVFMLRELVEANLYDRPEQVNNVISMLRDLRESWAEVDRLHNSNGLERQTNG